MKSMFKKMSIGLVLLTILALAQTARATTTGPYPFGPQPPNGASGWAIGQFGPSQGIQVGYGASNPAIPTNPIYANEDTPWIKQLTVPPSQPPPFPIYPALYTLTESILNVGTKAPLTIYRLTDWYEKIPTPG